MRFLPILLAAALLSSCTNPGKTKLAAPTPTFDPVAFFVGRTEGVGVYRRVLRRPKQIVVQTVGRYAEDHLQLSQRVLIEDEPQRRRTWDLYRVAPNRWRGTVSTATKPVFAETVGNAFHLRYTAEEGLRFDEYYFVGEDGRTALNRTVVTDLGVDFARIEGTVRRVE